MKKVIRSRVYDTDTAELMGSRYEGAFGDADGYSEEVFKSPEGYFFIYTAGGEGSPYPEEKIKPMSAQTAADWLEAHSA